MLDIKINIDSSGVSKHVGDLEKACKDNPALMQKVALGVSYLMRAKFAQNSRLPNRLNAPSTGFWKKAADSATQEWNGNKAVVRISHVGVSLQYYGGVVMPKNAQALAIPMRPQFHGRRPKEFPHEYFFAKRSRVKALSFLCVKPTNPDDKKINIAYLLVAKATIKPNKAAFPDDKEIQKRAADTIKFYFKG